MDGTDLEEDLDAAIRALLLDAAASGTVFREMIEDHFDWRGLEAGRPGQASPGKRVRPLLALVAARAIGGDHAPALPAAAALEVIHNFTLILDDIMDGDTQRRSRPALWVRWGAGSATTAALGFYTLSFRALLDAMGGGGGRALAAAQAVLTACMEIQEAQLRDLASEGRLALPAEDSLAVAYGRSSLIARAAEAGALTVTDDLRVIAACRDFGRAFAIAFSLLHDGCDLWGDERWNGKPPGSDLRQRKVTYPIAVGYQGADEAGRRLLDDLYRRERALTDVEVASALAVLARTDAARETLAAVARFRAHAASALGALGEAGRAALLPIVDAALAPGIRRLEAGLCSAAGAGDGVAARGAT